MPISPQPDRPTPETDTGRPRPEDIERDGTGLARAVTARDLTVDRVLVWDDAPAAVLGHVVARELGVGVTVVAEVEGLVELVDDLPAGEQVLLVSPAYRRPEEIMAMRSVTSRVGAVAVAVAAGRSTPACADEKARGGLPLLLPDSELGQ